SAAFRRISSTRRDVSSRPLRYLPTPVGKRRFAGAYASSASRTISASLRCSISTRWRSFSAAGPEISIMIELIPLSPWIGERVNGHRRRHVGRTFQSDATEESGWKAGRTILSDIQYCTLIRLLAADGRLEEPAELADDPLDLALLDHGLCRPEILHP